MPHQAPRQHSSYAHRALVWLAAVAPGLALAALLAWAGHALARLLGESLLGFDKSPLSPILLAILLGLLVRHAAGLPDSCDAGLKFAVKRVLRFGIALLGLRLSLFALGQIGASALPVVLGCIAAALVLVTWLSRAVGLPPRLGCLIAVGTSICGASAIVATGPAIDADEDEVSYAVATITLFGMTALLVYPYLAHWLFAGDAARVGLFLGTAIHDTSQVAGAGLIYQQQYDAPAALNVAATTKLVRNVCMGAVIPLMAILHHRRAAESRTGTGARPAWHQCVPLFVLAFVGLALARTVGDAATGSWRLFEPGPWQAFLVDARSLSVSCLTVAMGAIGLSTSVSRLRRLGWRPLAVGLAAALLTGAVSFALISASSSSL